MDGWKLISEESGSFALQAAKAVTEYVNGDVARMRLAGYPISERQYTEINNATVEMINGAGPYEVWRFVGGLRTLNELLEFHRLLGNFPTHHFAVHRFDHSSKNNQTKTYAILIDSHENQNPEFILPV